MLVGLKDILALAEKDGYCIPAFNVYNIETAKGVAINNLCYYPTINYVSWALNYYKLGDPIA